MNVNAMNDRDIENIINSVKYSLDRIEELSKQKGVDQKVIHILLGKCFGKLEILKEHRK